MKNNLFVAIGFNLILGFFSISTLLIFDDRYYENLIPICFFIFLNLIFSIIFLPILTYLQEKIKKNSTLFPNCIINSNLIFLLNLYFIINFSYYLADYQNPKFLFLDFFDLLWKLDFSNPSLLLNFFALISSVLLFSMLKSK